MGYRSNMLLLLFLSVPLLTTGLVGSEEVSVDTDECLRGAKASHGDNPNDDLDSFLACVLARLDAVETSDREGLDLKTQLAAIEDLPSFGKNGFKHTLARREAADEEEEEGRGWKNKEKKRKNKKEKKRRKKFEINLPKEETSVKKDSEVDDSGETEESDVGAEASFTSGLQFSAYSPHQGQGSTYGKKPKSGSSYKEQSPPVYMDAADVAELLGTPKAKKAMITFLAGSQETGNQIPSRLQEHFRPPAPRPPLPQWRLEQKPRPRQESRRPAQPRPFKGAPSNMQFFGPSDYVPELPHNVQGGVVRLQGGGRRVDDGNRILSQPGFLQRSPYQPDRRLPAVQKLEPKPRRRRATREASQRRKDSDTKAKKRENKNKNKKTGSERRVEKCLACKDEAFKAGQPEFCNKCDEFLAKKESTKCRHCKRKNFFRRNKEQCQKCVDTVSTTTTTTTTTTTKTTTTSTTTTTASPARQSLTA